LHPTTLKTSGRNLFAPPPVQGGEMIAWLLYFARGVGKGNFKKASSIRKWTNSQSNVDLFKTKTTGRGSKDTKEKRRGWGGLKTYGAQHNSTGKGKKEQVCDQPSRRWTQKTSGQLPPNNELLGLEKPREGQQRYCIR